MPRSLIILIYLKINRIEYIKRKCGWYCALRNFSSVWSWSFLSSPTAGVELHFPSVSSDYARIYKRSRQATYWLWPEQAHRINQDLPPSKSGWPTSSEDTRREPSGQLPRIPATIPTSASGTNEANTSIEKDRIRHEEYHKHILQHEIPLITFPIVFMFRNIIRHTNTQKRITANNAGTSHLFHSLPITVTNLLFLFHLFLFPSAFFCLAAFLKTPGESNTQHTFVVPFVNKRLHTGRLNIYFW